MSICGEVTKIAVNQSARPDAGNRLIGGVPHDRCQVAQSHLRRDSSSLAVRGSGSNFPAASRARWTQLTAWRRSNALAWSVALMIAKLSPAAESGKPPTSVSQKSLRKTRLVAQVSSMASGKSLERLARSVEVVGHRSPCWATPPSPEDRAYAPRRKVGAGVSQRVDQAGIGRARHGVGRVNEGQKPAAG